MLLGKSDVDIIELRKHMVDYETYCAYCDSLIPEEFRHVKELCDNQRYYCAMNIRKSEDIPWDKKKDLIVTVMSNVTVTGLTDMCIDIETLKPYMGRARMEKFFRRLKS